VNDDAAVARSLDIFNSLYKELNTFYVDTIDAQKSIENAINAMLDDIDPTILLYGEGWAAETPLLEESLRPIKANIAAMPGIGAFSDELRDALRGPFYDDHVGAFLAGLKGNEQSIRFGIVGAI
jgi:pullulanase